MVKAAGLDLAALPKNPSGWAVIDGNIVRTAHLYCDGEILRAILQERPDLLAIDAPLSLPKRGIYREADREMIKRGYRVFPPVLPAMKRLTLRAMKLVKLLEEEGMSVIEVHPLSTRKALNMPLRDVSEIIRVFKGMGLRLPRTDFSIHEVDAVSAALTAYLHLKGMTIEVGGKEGKIVLPAGRDWRELRLWR